MTKEYCNWEVSYTMTKEYCNWKKYRFETICLFFGIDLNDIVEVIESSESSKEGFDYIKYYKYNLPNYKKNDKALIPYIEVLDKILKDKGYKKNWIDIINEEYKFAEWCAEVFNLPTPVLNIQDINDLKNKPVYLDPAISEIINNTLLDEKKFDIFLDDLEIIYLNWKILREIINSDLNSYFTELIYKNKQELENTYFSLKHRPVLTSLEQIAENAYILQYSFEKKRVSKDRLVHHIQDCFKDIFDGSCLAYCIEHKEQLLNMNNTIFKILFAYSICKDGDEEDDDITEN